MSKMIDCKLCKTKELIDAVCRQCGFNNESKSFDGFGKLRIYHRKLNKEGPWVNEVELIERLNRIQRWSVREIEEKLDINRSTISLAVKLAKGIVKYPVLKEFENKSQANRFLQARESEMIGVRDLPEKESEIQKYLYNNWEETPFSEKWELVKKGTQADGNYDAGNGGILDLLAKGRNGRDWLVIELKRDQGSDETVGQLLRYMGWVKEKLSEEKDVVHGLIIASSSFITPNSPSIFSKCSFK